MNIAVTVFMFLLAGSFNVILGLENGSDFNNTQTRGLDSKVKRGDPVRGFKIESGSVYLHPWTGVKEKKVSIVFKQPFCSTPYIILEPTVLDIDKNFNTRLVIKAIDVTQNGFVLQVYTYADTILYAIEISWLAIY
ncbi:uncharacterized protein LOC129926918 [Biomphalaria glabrata]|uniref:Uncharacterized protein LOC129926918 n=1 Tax=Biomphalaria glabrata TaxID=6526 RepID=A0A9W3AQI9_BIOGL|nr:uncharacterized protein LOC129926918 [Biomphalaria glabrata]